MMNIVRLARAAHNISAQRDGGLTVGMPHLSEELHFRRIQREVLRERHGRSKEASFVQGIGGTKYSELPFINVIIID